MNLQADFWTSPWPYWNLKERASGVFESLKDSGLVIFKASSVQFKYAQLNMLY